MSEAAARLRRRPHLAPILLPLLALLAAGAGVFWLGTWARTTVVIVLKHAEAAAEPRGDPDLSPVGEARAAGLGDFLADALAGGKVDYLYAGDTRRAQQTALPIANRFGLPVNLLAPGEWDGLASRLRSDHRGRTVVVVGYSSTVPNLVAQLAGEGGRVSEAADGVAYVVVIPSPGSTRLFQLRYGPPGKALASR
jgi:phosphohistidine phosphatase SixA